MPRLPRLRLPCWRLMRYNGPWTANARKRSLSSRKGSSMWWLEPHRKVHQLPRLALALALSALVAGCFQPLYGARTMEGASVADQLKLVDVAHINVPNGTPEASLASELRNVLIFELAGGAPTRAPTHRLTIQMSTIRQQVIVDITTSRPDVEQTGVNADYTLSEIGSGKVV